MNRVLLLAFLMATLVVGVVFYLRPVGGPSLLDNAGNGKSRAGEGFLTTRKDFNDELEDLKRRRNEVSVQMDRIEQRKKKAAERIRDAGVKTAGDVDKNQTAKLDIAEFEKLKKLSGKMQADVEIYDQAIASIEAGLRDIEIRQLGENVAINDEKYKKLRTIVIDLEDRLLKDRDAFQEVQTQDQVDEILEYLEKDK